jgi:hypothetical protein
MCPIWISALVLESFFSQGFAVAKEGAIGPVAVADHVNTEQAALGQSYLWVLGAIVVLVIVPAVWHSNAVRRRMGAERG